jgi:hypothetical protein
VCRVAELGSLGHMSAPLPTVAEAQRIIHDSELCHSMTKFMAAQALLEACERDPKVTLKDLLRCLDYGGVIAETGARSLYVRTGRDGRRWGASDPEDLPFIVDRADWEIYLREHHLSNVA